MDVHPVSSIHYFVPVLCQRSTGMISSLPEAERLTGGMYGLTGHEGRTLGDDGDYMTPEVLTAGSVKSICIVECDAV